MVPKNSWQCSPQSSWQCALEEFSPEEYDHAALSTWQCDPEQYRATQYKTKESYASARAWLL
jgi:hypothetical protein